MLKLIIKTNKIITIMTYRTGHPLRRSTYDAPPPLAEKPKKYQAHRGANPPQVARVLKDKLLPTPANPTMRYVDYDENGHEVWRVNIKCFHDRESPLSKTENHQANTLGLRSVPYESLDALIEDVWDKRIEKYGHPRISADDLQKQKFFIAHSATNQYDLVASVEPSEKLIQGVRDRNPRVSKKGSNK